MNNAPPMMYGIVLESYRRLIQTSDATIIAQICVKIRHKSGSVFALVLIHRPL